MSIVAYTLGVAKRTEAFLAWTGFALAALGVAQAAGPAAPTQLTLEDFCSNEAILSPQLSPDGTRIAFATPIDGIFALALFHLDTGKVDLLVREGEGDITTVFWKSNDRLILNADLNAALNILAAGLAVSARGGSETIPAREPRTHPRVRRKPAGSTGIPVKAAFTA
jgi:hypothetical protein